MLTVHVVVRRLAFLGLVLVACAAGTACIFDDGGDYTGGGRRDIGAKLNEGETPPTEDGGTSSGSTANDSGSSSPFPDSGGGGG